MNFRTTVRDGNGGINSDDVLITVVDTGTSFAVTSTGTENWTGGVTEAIAWDVAGTTGNEINVADVAIDLSIDGGLTYPFVLSNSTQSNPIIQSIFKTVVKMHRQFLIAAVCLCYFSSCWTAPADSLPNVIFVLADDLGIGDVSPTNPQCKIKTPNLQAMAEQGLTFLDAHSSSSVCTPTRYGLMTGRYNWRSRLSKGVLGGSSKHLIPAERETVAHLLHRAGYHSKMIGKWHLGWDWAKHKVDGKLKIDFTKPVTNGPNINGFDNYYGHCGSLDMAPYVWVDTGKVTALPDREEGVTRQEDQYGWYRKGPISPDFKIDEVLPHLFEKGIEYINQRTNDENAGQVNAGQANTGQANAGKPFFLYLPLPAPHTPIVPVPPFKGASGMNPYADFVMQVDHHMGELFEAINAAGIDDNTIVFFSSDNGCSPEGNFEKLREYDHDPSAGFRGHKADIYEGGHRVPMIVRWPGKIKPTRTTKTLACLTDFYATMRQITKQPPIDTGGEDSFSLLPVFNGDEQGQRANLISHSIGGFFSIRQGDWKLCLSAGSGGWSHPSENKAKELNLPKHQLFNLNSDPGEKTNLHDQHPEKVEQLMGLLQEQVHAGRCTPGESVPNDREIQLIR